MPPGRQSRTSSGPTAGQLPADFVFALLACAVIGYSLGFFWGNRAPRAIQPLALGGLLVLWRYAGLALKRGPAVIAAELVWLPLVFLLFMMGWLAYEDQALLNVVMPWPNGRNGQLALCALVLTYLPGALGVREPPWVGHVRFAAFAALVTIVGWHALHASPAPRIDVWELQQRGVELLLQGKNPYQGFAVRDTGWGVAMPFVYPPTVLYLGIPGKQLLGDVRYSGLVVIVMTGLGMRAIARAGARRSGLVLPALGIDAAALVFWLQPKLFFVLEQAWIDVYQLGFLSVGLAVFLVRFRGARMVAAVLLGVAFSSKQTMFWFLPLVFLFLQLRPREWIALVATVAILAGPFVLWDLHAFKAANFDVHANLTPRRDALGFMAWWYFKYQQWRSTAWLAWGASIGVLAVGAWRLRGSLLGFGLASTAIYFLFFFFQKWAFANYYYLVDGLAAIAAALALHTAAPGAPPGSPAPPETALSDVVPETSPVS